MQICLLSANVPYSPEKLYSPSCELNTKSEYGLILHILPSYEAKPEPGSLEHTQF